ncbi:MAG: hypothetical protein ACYCPN_04110 [Thermoplasmata archaeon]
MEGSVRADPAAVQHCPFCGAAESARLALEGTQFLVFPCMFTPSIDPAWDESEITRHLATDYTEGGTRYFRGICDRLHRFVVREPGGPTPPAQNR